jgi:hypothetical protein
MWYLRDKTCRDSSELPRLRSGFRLPALTPAKRFNFDFARIGQLSYNLAAALRSGKQE